MKKKILWIFGISIALHLELAIFFSSRFGPHAVVTREIWYYYGLLKGNWHLPILDPTQWIMQIISFFPETLWLLGLKVAASLLSGLTACLIFLLGKKLINSYFGVISAVIYIFMHGPLTISTVNFTHDLVMVPLLLILLLWGKLGIVPLSIILCGILIGSFPVIVGGLILILYFAVNRFKKGKQIFVFVSMLTVLLLARIAFMPQVMELAHNLSQSVRGISILAQLKAGASDLLPISLKDIINRYGLWLVPTGIGFCFALKKREWMSVLICTFALLASTVVGRSLRIVDIGIALLAAHALISINKKKFAYIALIILSCFSLFMCHVFLRPNTTEAEYQILKEVNEVSRPGEKILVTWHDGYMVQALTHLVPTATPERIDLVLPKVYWKSELEAYDLLKKREVDLVFVINRYFGIRNIHPVTGVFDYVGDGSLLYPPGEEGIVTFDQIQNTFLFRLMDDAKRLSRFDLVLEKQDRYTPAWIRIYRLK
ncbi:MAG: hypothetical protein QGI05_02055 [Candidatus Omnitrophota bacterium]|nr:hypothetical protein [Candidatus Omnitrophota bacterium]